MWVDVSSEKSHIILMGGGLIDGEGVWGSSLYNILEGYHQMSSFSSHYSLYWNNATIKLIINVG